MPALKSLIASFFIITLSITLSADEIVLVNGDILQGLQTERTDSHIIWNSDNFGPLSIALDQIATITPEVLNPIIAATAVTEVAGDGPLEGAIGLSGLLRSGNEDREEWGAAIDLAWRNKNIRHRGDIHYQTRREGDEAAEKHYDIDYAFDWFFRDSWYWSNTASFGANDDRGIDQFYTVGSLIGNQLWEQDSGALSVESGLTWISETFAVSTRDQRFMRDKKDERLTWNWSADYRKIVFSNIEFFHTHQLLVSVEDADNSQLNTDIGFDFPMIDNLFTEIALKWDYDNQPVEGFEKIDRKISVGVNYSW